MAIRIRRGNQVDFDKNKLVQGELAIVLDAGELHFCYGPGNTKRLATKEDLQEMLNASETSYSALLQLIADLENDPNELTNILNNISALQSGKLDKAEKGVTIATLVDGKVPSEQLPPISSSASDITYDNTESGLQATDTQGAIDEVNSQLAERATYEYVDEKVLDVPKIKTFQSMPTPADLAEGEVGLVLIPMFPFSYQFGEADGFPWDKYLFKTTKYEAVDGLLNQPESFADIQGGKGRVKITKGTSAGICCVDNTIFTKLDFTNNKKYRIKIDMKNGSSSPNVGNCGITLSPDTGVETYYPGIVQIANGYSIFLNGGPTIRVKARKILNRVLSVDEFISVNGGYTSVTADRLVIAQDTFASMQIEISATTVKLTVDNVVYLDIAEDLSILNNQGIILSLWGMNNDAGSLVVEHFFDNLLISEVV